MEKFKDAKSSADEWMTDEESCEDYVMGWGEMWNSQVRMTIISDII